MTPSELRAVLRSEFEDWFRIDKWSIGLPEEVKDFNRPPSVGREKPVSEVLAIERIVNRPRNTNYLIRERRSLQGIYRLPRVLQYAEVIQDYRNPFEDRITAFCASLQYQPPIGVNTVECSARVSCPELKSGDWLLTTSIEFTITYESSHCCTDTPLFT